LSGVTLTAVSDCWRNRDDGAVYLVTCSSVCLGFRDLQTVSDHLHCVCRYDGWLHPLGISFW